MENIFNFHSFYRGIFIGGSNYRQKRNYRQIRHVFYE